MVIPAIIGRRVTVTTFYLLLFLLILNTLPTISAASQSSQEQKEDIDYYDEGNTISTTAATTATSSSVGNKNNDDNGNTTTTKNPLLFANFNSLYKERQGFFLLEGNGLFESPPDSKLSPFKVLSWWCGLEFLKLSSSSEEEKIENYYYDGGYTGRTVNFFLDPGVTTSGGSNKYIGSVSAMFIPSRNTFEGQIHSTGENWVDRFWDDGISSAPMRYISWDTMSFSGFGTYTKITSEQAADYFSNNSIDINKLTPETCSDLYKEVRENNTNNKQQLQEQNQQQKQPDHKINTSKTTETISPKEEDEEEEISQLKAINSDLISRVEVIENILAYHCGDNGKGTEDVVPSCNKNKNDIKNGINIVGNVNKHCIAFLSATANLIHKASLISSLRV
jgi:hypothetical protein